MEEDKFPHWADDMTLVHYIAIGITCYIDGLDKYEITQIVLKEVSEWRKKMDDYEREKK